MPKSSTADGVEGRLARLRSLLRVISFVHETAAPADWTRLTDDVGFMLWLMEDELRDAEEGLHDIAAARKAAGKTEKGLH